MFELIDTRDELEVVDMGKFLVEEKGWPAAFAARNIDLFAGAVKARYVEVHGCEPVWDRGFVYRGIGDWLLMHDVYAEAMGALAEQIDAEGGVR